MPTSSAQPSKAGSFVSGASSASFRPPASSAWADLVIGFTKSELWGRIGWLEVKRRYRRTTLGPFWGALTLAMYVVAVGIVGSGLWHLDVRNYLPYLGSGMIVWTLVSTIILESCTLFVLGHALLRNLRFEYSILAYGLVWRNFVVFLHNFVMYVFLVLVLKPEFISLKALIAIPGLILVLVNGVWIALLIGMVCLRYRDVQQVISTVLQIWMLITPIFWVPNNLSGFHNLIFVQFNPVYHIIEIVRAPLLGRVPTVANYTAVLLITVVGWSVAFRVFQKFRKRISYWS
jgi:ABC-type polysaccharide/polyol phosphate export permease